MKMLNRKSKMVSFRLSPEEYSIFRNACASNGVRSISELARTAMQAMVTATGAGGTSKPAAKPATLDDQVRELRQKVDDLSDQITRLTRRVETEGEKE